MIDSGESHEELGAPNGDQTRLDILTWITVWDTVLYGRNRVVVRQGGMHGEALDWLGDTQRVYGSGANRS